MTNIAKNIANKKTDKPKPEDFSFMPVVFIKHELLDIPTHGDTITIYL